MRYLPLDEAKDYLRRRRMILEHTLTEVKKHREEQLAIPDVPALAGAIFDHTLVHTEAELRWVTVTYWKKWKAACIRKADNFFTKYTSLYIKYRI